MGSLENGTEQQPVTLLGALVLVSSPKQYPPWVCCSDLHHLEVSGMGRHSTEISRGDLVPPTAELKDLIASLTQGTGQKMLP